MLERPDDAFSTGLRLIGRCVANGADIAGAAPRHRGPVGRALARHRIPASRTGRPGARRRLFPPASSGGSKTPGDPLAPGDRRGGDHRGAGGSRPHPGGGRRPARGRSGDLHEPARPRTVAQGAWPGGGGQGRPARTPTGDDVRGVRGAVRLPRRARALARSASEPDRSGVRPLHPAAPSPVRPRRPSRRPRRRGGRWRCPPWRTATGGTVRRP